MSKRKRLSRKDKPNWFNLDKYAGLEHWELDQWRDQLEVRYRLYQKIIDPKNKTQLPTIGINELIESKNAFIPLRKLIIHGDPNIYKDPTCQESVRSMGCLSALFLHRRLPKSLKLLGEKYEHEKKSGHDPRSLIKHSYPLIAYMYDEEVCEKEELSKTYILIDLSKPDSILFEDFKEFVASARKEYEIPEPEQSKPEQSNLLDRWRTRRLLPYIDLKIWLDFNNYTVSREVFAEWVDVEPHVVRDTLEMYFKKFTETNLIYSMYERHFMRTEEY